MSIRLLDHLLNSGKTQATITGDHVHITQPSYPNLQLEARLTLSGNRVLDWQLTGQAPTPLGMLTVNTRFDVDTPIPSPHGGLIAPIGDTPTEQDVCRTLAATVAAISRNLDSLLQIKPMLGVGIEDVTPAIV